VGSNCYSNGANVIINGQCYRCSNGDADGVAMSVCTGSGSGSGSSGTGSTGTGSSGTQPTQPCVECGSPGSCYVKTENKTWDAWSTWAVCSGDISSATMTHNRTCGSRGLSCGGSDQCSGASQEFQNCSILTSAVWRDLAGNITPSSSVGDSVIMFIDGIGLSDINIQYSVYSRDESSWRNLWGLLRRSFRSAEITDYPIYTFINNSDHYYSANTTNNNGLSLINSSIIPVSQNSSTSNAMPVANITSPANYYLTSANCSIPFTQASYDEDDLLNLSWDFGDGNHSENYLNYAKVINPFQADINHSYSSGGREYNFVLRAVEMTRGQGDTDSRSIYVFQPGINVVPIITSPENGVGYGNWVEFNISQSYVVNCSADMPNANFSVCNGALSCKYIHAPGKVAINTTDEHYDLMVNWTVKDPAGNVQMTKNGWWSTNYSGTPGVVVFSGHFSQPGAHYANLSLNYFPK